MGVYPNNLKCRGLQLSIQNGLVFPFLSVYRKWHRKKAPLATGKDFFSLLLRLSSFSWCSRPNGFVLWVKWGVKQSIDDFQLLSVIFLFYEHVK